jgi:S1-C subfamily serine protease
VWQTRLAMRLGLVAPSFVALALVTASCSADDSGVTNTTESDTATEAHQGSGPGDIYFGQFQATTATAGKPGVVVLKVEANSPLSASGLQRGDVITAVDGAPMTAANELSEFFDQLPETRDAGDKVEITLTRGSRELTVTVRLAANVYIGAQLLASTAGEQGARVGAVPAGTPAAAAGLRRDDLITALDGAPVAGSNQLIQALATHQPGDEVEISVTRGSRQLTLSATLAKRTAPK